MIDHNTTSAIGVLTRNFYVLDRADDAASGSMADDNDADFLDQCPASAYAPMPPAGPPSRRIRGEEMVTVEAIMVMTDAAIWLGYRGPMQHPVRASMPRRVAERGGYAIIEDDAAFPKKEQA